MSSSRRLGRPAAAPPGSGLGRPGRAAQSGAARRRVSTSCFSRCRKAAAAELAPPLVDAGVRVIDLSGAFRIRDDAARVALVSGDEVAAGGRRVRPDRALQERRARTRSSSPIPGCYPTAALLALLPLAQARACSTRRRTSSSTRSPASPARAARRAIARTSPRITARSRRTASSAIATSPRWSRSSARRSRSCRTSCRSIAAFSRRSTCSVAPGTTAEQIADAFTAAYADEPFVRLTGDALPEIKHVAWTNFCDIGWRLDAALAPARHRRVPRQPREGRGGPGAAELQRRLRLRRTDGAAVTGPLVLKLGGELLEIAANSARDRARAPRRVASRRPLVIVHGGGRAIDAELDRRGIAPKKVDGLRITDAPTLDVVVSVLGGVGEHRARRRARRPTACRRSA